MLKIAVLRTYESTKTEGLLVTPSGLQMTTLERPWLDNAPNISCIPDGDYEVHRDKHGRHTWFRVLDVKGRTAIEIHEGYKVEHSQGCILLDLIELQDLLLETKGEPFILSITS